ncbi:hypothetical protein L1049_001561 [Liquidambar formosana]|uniref:Uncharacterized protein n=1 Tax=Liquidambar formosana TaxID=63359 RepID=A0AAP0NBQ2_LIQFO
MNNLSSPPLVGHREHKQKTTKQDNELQTNIDTPTHKIHNLRGTKCRIREQIHIFQGNKGTNKVHLGRGHHTSQKTKKHKQQHKQRIEYQCLCTNRSNKKTSTNKAESHAN